MKPTQNVPYNPDPFGIGGGKKNYMSLDEPIPLTPMQESIKRARGGGGKRTYWRYSEKDMPSVTDELMADLADPAWNAIGSAEVAAGKAIQRGIETFPEVVSNAGKRFVSWLKRYATPARGESTKEANDRFRKENR